MTDYCLQGARLIDPEQKLDEVRDLGIVNGKITFELPDSGVEKIDLSNKVIMPGLVDLRGHLLEPETFFSLSKAASSGGYTTTLIMPNIGSGSTIDNPGTVHLMREKASKDADIQILHCGSLTKGQKGELLAPLGSLKEAGIVAVSDCPQSTQNTKIFAKGLEYASMFDLPVIEYPRDMAISDLGDSHEGALGLKMGIGGYPRMAEELFVQRAITISSNLCARIHISSISSGGSVDLIRNAKARGLSISADTTPHHLALTDINLLGYDSNSKTMPPLREEKDRKKILEGITDGTIDSICSAHEPCHEHEKQVEFDKAPAGVISYETALPVVFDQLKKSPSEPFSQIALTMSLNPSRTINIDNGIWEGNAANLFAFDPDRKWIYRVDLGKSNARNSPFEEKAMTGKVLLTFASGKKVFSELID